MPLSRLTRLYDSAEQLEDMWGEEEGAMEEEGEEVEIWKMDQDGHWVEGSPDDEDEWESADEDDPDEVMEDALEEPDGGGDWPPSPVAVDATPPSTDSHSPSSMSNGHTHCRRPKGCDRGRWRG